MYLKEMSALTGLIDPNGIDEKGKELAAEYQRGEPFPYIVIDDFMPSEMLESCLNGFSSLKDLKDSKYNAPQERLKSSFNPDIMPQELRSLFYSFNSRPFLKIIENITGIKGLIPDPYFLGAGFHEIQQGGHLSVHADFNHHVLMNLERRVNVLIYMNKDWQDNYGGQLELWDKTMTHAIRNIVPLFNRCVIFSTTSESYHGNPNPVAHPDLVSRKSIALYYYTATWTIAKRSHTTQFQVRPNSHDKSAKIVMARELIVDFIPPILYRGLRDLKKILKN